MYKQNKNTMTQEQLRMQMLAGIITEGQYKEKMEEVDSMGKVGNSYPTPGAETEKLRDKADDLYTDMIDLFMENPYYNDDYVDSAILNSVPYDIRQKVADENGGSLGLGAGYTVTSKFLTEEELRKIIQILEGVFKLVSNSEEGEDRINFRNYKFDNNKLEFVQK
jgi:hypothetical protein